MYVYIYFEYAYAGPYMHFQVLTAKISGFGLKVSEVESISLHLDVGA